MDQGREEVTQVFSINYQRLSGWIRDFDSSKADAFKVSF